MQHQHLNSIFSAVEKGKSVKPKTYTHSDIVDGLTVHHGVDVSEHQGKINWAKAKKSGVEFAIIRVGCRRLASGQFKEDDYFYQNMEGAINAGIKVGVYFYSGATTEKKLLKRLIMCLNE